MRCLIIILLLTSFNGQAQTAVLNGSASENAVTYRWKQISGPESLVRAPDSVISKVDSLTFGERLFELTCTNEWGESRDSVKISAVDYGVNITSAIYKTTSLTWTVTGEQNVWYYWIQKTRNVSTTQVTKYYAKGLTKYVYRQARTVYKYTYEVTPIFRNGTPGKKAVFL